MIFVNWNKEKVVFAASLLVLAAVAWKSIQFLGGGVTAKELTVEQPSSGGSVPPAQVELSWFRLTEDFQSARDPFRSESSWRPAIADGLAHPPLSALSRRVPLPAPIARSLRARPPQESEAPEILLEEN